MSGYDGLVTLVAALKWYRNRGYLINLPHYLDLSFETILKEAEEDLKKVKEGV